MTNSFTTQYIPDEGNTVIKFERGKFGLEFYINDTPWNADSVQSYELTGDETDQLRRLLGCSGVDSEKTDDVYRYHIYAEYPPYGRLWTIDKIYSNQVDPFKDIEPLITDYLVLKEMICNDQGLDCDPSELIIKSLTRL